MLMGKNLSYEELKKLSEEHQNLMLALNFSESELKMCEQLKKEMGSSRDKGKVFEDMIKTFFKDALFDVKSNAYTSSNEIDFVIELTPYAKLLRRDGIIPKWLSDYIIAECKNYNKRIEVTFVGKFYSLLSSYKDVRVGIFFSNKPISGHGEKYWKHASALVNKINIREEKILLDINFDYIETKMKSESSSIGIIKLISDRHKEIQLDITSSVYKNIIAHENQDKLKMQQKTSMPSQRSSLDNMEVFCLLNITTALSAFGNVHS